jgi:hypothetical protein
MLRAHALAQVVDGNWGMGLSIPKFVFEQKAGNRARYTPKVVCGSSVPL